ncbi:MAG: sodium/solute symporter [Elusimicrobia bacterium]|nr:sodium/solute symporter [Elusimicrobiota bacterium]
MNEGASWFAGGTALTLADFTVLLGTLGLMFLIGWWGGRGAKDTNDFFLGGRRIPWWAAMLSFVATEISAMTIIGVPATTFREDWSYMQFFIGSSGARILIAFLFIPAFYKYNSTTIYEYLRQRFGARSQYTATGFFFVTRLLASGVRLMAASVAVSVLLGWHIAPTILLFTLVSVAYIAYGGIESVVWTNVLQALTFLGVGILTIAFLIHRIEGGLPAAIGLASDAGKLRIFNWGPNVLEPGFLAKFFGNPNIIWIAILNGFIGSTAAFGTDHEMTQKLLTVETRRDSQKTILLSIAGSFLTLCVFVGVGSLLFVFYKQNPGLALPTQLDKIYPHFAATVMPRFLRGAVLTAIVMASIDSPLASLTAVFVNDLYKPLAAKAASQEHYMKVSRVCVALFAAALGGIAYFFSFFDKMLWLAFKIGGVTYGSLLGVFLLGMLTKRKGDKAVVVAMGTMAAVNAVLLVLSEKGMVPLGWSWLVIIGTAGTFGLGWALAPALDGEGRAASAA